MKYQKSVFEQYDDLLVEIKNIRNDIEKTEDALIKLVEDGTVVDKVTGGYGGIQGFKIEGFPQKEYDRRYALLSNRQLRLQQRETDLIEIRENIEKEIEKIEKSRDRTIFRGIFLEGKTQEQVARELFIERSLVSKIISKYF